MSKHTDRWPHIDDEVLIALWERHTPTFLRLDDPWKDSLQRIRIPFLTWLESMGVPLDEPIALGAHEYHTVSRPGPRMKLEGVDFRRFGSGAEAIVSISLRGQTIETSCSKQIFSDRYLWLPAEAVMAAARQLLPVVEFEIENAFSVPFSEDGGLAAVVIARDPEGVIPHRLVGACEISSTEPEAGAKAALAAINRHAEIAAGFYASAGG